MSKALRISSAPRSKSQLTLSSDWNGRYSWTRKPKAWITESTNISSMNNIPSVMWYYSKLRIWAYFMHECVWLRSPAVAKWRHFVCDLASSSVKSSNALTAKSQKRSKKGKRGRSSTGSLTEALNVTRITTAGPAREEATSSQQKKHTDDHGCNVGKEGWKTERVTARALQLSLRPYSCRRFGGRTNWAYKCCCILIRFLNATGLIPDLQVLRCWFHPVEVQLVAMNACSCFEKWCMDLSGLSCCIVHVMPAKVVRLQCWRKVVGFCRPFSPQMAGWKTLWCKPLQPTRCHPRFESTQWLKC